MAKITIEELSGSLKEYLNGLGLTEAQVQELIDRFEDEKIGDISQLNTEEKGSLVGAINELFQDVDSGKQLIADAIDDGVVTKDSTFAAMGEAIEGIHVDIENNRNILNNIMLNNGYDVNNEMTLGEMINKLSNNGVIGQSGIKQIAAGGVHICVLYNNGNLFVSGYNNAGQLGVGDTAETKNFVMSHISNVKYVACGQLHTLVVKYDGSLWACGYNYSGQLGLGNYDDKNTFTQVTTNINNDVKQVSCGQYHTMILKNDGSIWACGACSKGQLGIGSSSGTKTTFTRVTSNVNNVKEISCGYAQSFMLKNDGTLWACGNNVTGQLGRGNTTGSSSFVQVASDVKKVSTAGSYPTNNLYTDYSIGNTFIIKNDGSLWACGYNTNGQLGLGDADQRNSFTQVTTNINNDVRDVVCALYQTYIVKNDGSLWSCGNNSKGQLGLGNTTNKTTFTQVTTNINNDVKYIACVYPQYYTEGTTVGSIFVLRNNDSLYSCGYNNHGQLGLGDITDRTSLVKTNLYIY